MVSEGRLTNITYWYLANGHEILHPQNAKPTILIVEPNGGGDEACHVIELGEFAKGVSSVVKLSRS